MKNALVIIIVFILIMVGFSANQKKSFAQDVEYVDYTGKIISFLGCECELVKNTETISMIMKKYENLLILGKEEGFTPLIIVPSRMLCEIIDWTSSHYGNNGHLNSIIETKSKAVNVAEFLNSAKNTMPIEEDIVGDFIYYKPTNSFASLIDYATGRPYETIIIAKIPTDKPWELAAWIPMGGWNECPAPEVQVAVFKYWYEKYGAIPAVVHSDIWELYVEKPPSTKDVATALAWEQFGFCSDIIWQGAQKINVLASTLLNSKIWYFWWD